MLETLFLLMAWSVDPGSAGRQAVRSSATCVRPTAMVVKQSSACAASSDCVTEPNPTRETLQRWARASASIPALSRSQRETIHRQIQDELNAHAAEAVDQLLGRVSASRLMNTFEWTLAESDAKQICLEAVACDSTERLFYRSIRVSLCAERFVPQSISVIDRRRSDRIVWREQAASDNGFVQLVLYDNHVPPAPILP